MDHLETEPPGLDLGAAPVIEETLDPNRPSRLLIATVDQTDARLLRTTIEGAELRYAPQEILTAHTLEEIHAIVTGKPPPTAVLLDLHFETHTHDGIDFKTIAQDLADCRGRYLAVMVSNGLTAGDELRERERALEYGMRPNALAKQSVLRTINGIRDLLLAMDCFRKKPPKDGRNTLMLSLLDARRGTSVLG